MSRSESLLAGPSANMRSSDEDNVGGGSVGVDSERVLLSPNRPRAASDVVGPCGIRRAWRYPLLLTLVLLIVLIVMVSLLWNDRVRRGSGGGNGSASRPGPSKYASVAQCLAENRPPNLSVKQPPFPAVDPSVPAPPPPPSVLFTHANIWTGDSALRTDADLLIQNGVVTAVSSASGERLPVPTDDDTLVTYDATGRWITPGLFDMHSHAGLAAWPGDLWATDDVNEMTAPTVAQMRAVDALDPLDAAFPAILAMGVTSSQIMPGSGTAMGGEGALVKNVGGGTVDDMLIRDAPRLMKMACGENVKRVFGQGDFTKGVAAMPMSRLGSAWVMRRRLEQAAELRAAQDAWCENVANAQYTKPFPNAREHESLAALLRGEVKLNTHCYLVHDFEMMIRLSTEFNFNISAFHHALSAWRMADVFAARNISVATFVDHGLYKYEGYDASTQSAAILHAAGVNTVVKTDHPVLFSGTLGWEAAKAAHYGLPAQAAIASVTSNPARSAGLDHRIGTLAPGMDADVVVWDRDPLVLGAKPASVFVEGKRMVHSNAAVVPHPDSTQVNPDMVSQGPAQVCGLYNDTQTVLDDVYRTVGLACYAIRDVTIYTGDNVIQDGSMVVQNGVITCVGSSASCPTPTVTPACQVFTGVGGVLTPGFVEAASHTGLFDISSEGTTGDGSLAAGPEGSFAAISTVDGIRTGSRHVRAAWAGGVTTVLATPVRTQLVQGLSSAFRTCCGNTLAGLSEDDFGADGSGGLIVSNATALHIVVGNGAKGSGGSTSAISGQLVTLRKLFTAARTAAASATELDADAPLSPFVRALRGELRVAVQVDQADEILAVLRLQRQFGFPLTITSGAESALVAKQIAATTPPTSVLLYSRVLPNSFETFRARPDTVRILREAGVVVGLSTGDTDMLRNLRWEAGWNQDASGLTEQQTVESVTSVVADLFDLPTGRLAVDRPAEFVLFNGSPFSLQTRVQLVGMGEQVDCRPKQR